MIWFVIRITMQLSHIFNASELHYSKEDLPLELDLLLSFIKSHHALLPESS